MFSFLRPAAPKPRLAPAEAIARARAGTLTLIDVREAGEIAQTGRAEDALHVPLALVPLKCDPASPDCPAGLSPDRAIGVYCASGGRSGLAAQALERLGYEVYNLGGLRDLAAAGARITR